MRIEVRAHGEVHGADFVLLPAFVAVNRIYANVQDLGIKRGELLPVGVERRQLLPSSRGPVDRMERHHNIFLSAIVAEPNLKLAFALDCRQLEIRRRFADLQWHSGDSPVVAFYMEKTSAADSRESTRIKQSSPPRSRRTPRSTKGKTPFEDRFVFSFFSC